MHSFTILATLLSLAGIHAAPAPEPLTKRVSDVSINIYDGASCGTSQGAVSVASIPADGGCYGISAILTQNTDAGLITTQLPAGCTVTFYTNPTCSSVNQHAGTKTGECFQFGAGQFINSARTVGNCS
ncbi:hypothetical protein EJ04DRAFT_446677 [Polyplosphaeria fusca]|uniref:Uncharacterized protein n=1 Tax=Polyplosphaeria fusca TaxID=682080 RepID=A0A9P4UYZ7_9PLEO|nr:hypothetical protein EJ04DRAFT_446677 [Polyplosphaeria fusca]